MLGGHKLGKIESGLLTLAASDCGSIAAMYDRRVTGAKSKHPPDFTPEERRLLEAMYRVWLATEYGTRDVFECEWPDDA